jgi:hypothetical protein
MSLGPNFGLNKFLAAVIILSGVTYPGGVAAISTVITPYYLLNFLGTNLTCAYSFPFVMLR